MNKWVFVLLILVRVALFEPSMASAEERSWLIFVDVSSSLADDEFQQAVELLGGLLTRLESRDQFAVYAVHQKPESQGPVQRGTVPPRTNRAGEALRQKVLRQMAVQIGKDLTEVRKAVNQPPAPDRRSCLTNTLSMIDAHHRNFPKRKLHVVYLSDMIEECVASPFGPLNLDQAALSTELVKLAKPRVPCAVPADSVWMVLPGTASTVRRVSPRPASRDLEDFWRRVLERCGWTQARVSEPGRFSFSAEVPAASLLTTLP